MEKKYPLPPFTLETAMQKVQAAEDAWNSKDPVKVSKAYSTDTEWRNRIEFLNGREEVQAFYAQNFYFCRMNGVEVITKYFPNLTENQISQFTQLKALYSEWNAQINVISRKDIDELYVRHVLHSLAIAKFVQFPAGAKVLDVGCGGGFPGIPLAIMFPEVAFTMVDSIGKKIKVVKGVAQSLGLTNVQAHHMRAEQVDDQFNVVVSRAVTRMKPFKQWVQNKMDAKTIKGLDNGILALKGGDLNEEMSEIKTPYQEVSLTQYFEEDFFETKKLIFVPFS